MAKNKRQSHIPAAAPTVTPRIGAAATRSVPENADRLHPLFRFGSTDEARYCLHECQKDELRALVKTFKLMEAMTWLEVRKSEGLHYKPYDRATFRSAIRQALVDLAPPEAVIHSFRASRQFRVYGYRAAEIFSILWFDREHAVCPD